MNDHATHGSLNKITLGGLIITLGIIYGDIGTSPLYVMKAIAGDRLISADLILGGVSCIFWTLTLQTSLKYIVLTLRADNKGEGGIFALYALVRRTKVKWLLFPAIIGGAALFLSIGELISNKYPQSSFAKSWRHYVSDTDPDEM
jgi:KUP system potassium uptake protein